MHEIAPDLYILSGFPPHSINAYLMNGVLVDARIRYSHGRLLRQLRGQRVRAHVLTHAHPDHQGASAALCTTLGVPLWCGAGDVAAVVSGAIATLLPRHWVNRLIASICAGPGYPVTRILREGDEVAGFTVLEVPGHTPGHLAYWRDRDRTLLVGDVLTNLDPLTGQVGLREPYRLFTPDPARNRESARKLLDLRPRLVCFGHGPPLRDGARFEEFVAQLPR